MSEDETLLSRVAEALERIATILEKEYERHNSM